MKKTKLLLATAFFLVTWNKGNPNAQEGKEIRLTLEDALRLAKEQNLMLKAFSLNIPIARAWILAAKGAFDPAVYLSPEYRRSETVPWSSFRPSLESKIYGFRTGIMTKLAPGTLLDLSFDYRHNRYESITMAGLGTGGFGLGTRFFSRWSGLLSFNITQPLLKGAWNEVNLADIRKAELGAKSAGKMYTDLTNEVLYNTSAAYWNLVFAMEYYKVVTYSLEVAKRQLQITQERIKAGFAADVEIYAPKADIARREQDLIQAKNMINKAEDILKSIIFSFFKEKEK